MITSFLTDGAAKIVTRLKNLSVLTIKHWPAGRQRAKNIVCLFVTEGHNSASRRAPHYYISVQLRELGQSPI